MEPQIYRRTDLLRILGICSTSFWQLRRETDFPKPIKLSGNILGWRREDVAAWIAKRPTAN